MWNRVSRLAPDTLAVLWKSPLDFPGLYIKQCVAPFYVAETLLGVLCLEFTLAHPGVALWQ